MKKAVIYTRHFTYRTDKYNTAVQIYNCKQCAEEKEMEVVNIYSDTSAEKLKHYPMFEQMKKDCRRKNKPDAIIIYSLQTLGRRLYKTQRFIASMINKGIEVIFVTLDSSPDKYFYEELLGFLNPYIKGDK